MSAGGDPAARMRRSTAEAATAERLTPGTGVAEAGHDGRAGCPLPTSATAKPPNGTTTAHARTTRRRSERRRLPYGPGGARALPRRSSSRSGGVVTERGSFQLARRAGGRCRHRHVSWHRTRPSDSPAPPARRSQAASSAVDLGYVRGRSRADRSGAGRPPERRLAEPAEAAPENPARALIPPATAEVEGILSTLSVRRAGEDLELVRRAHAFATKAHEGQRRLSGEPYITHPVAVATIIADLGLDTVSAAAALLHDAVEDTGVSLAQIEAEFGPAVAAIVDGVTKLDRLRFDSKEAQQAATMRKMLVAMARDWRVLVIKLADRLHNMRTLSVMPEWKQRRTAEETRDIYAPLAHRLGIQEIKWQLEDLAFETLHPKRFAEIAQMVATRAPRREVELAEVLARRALPARRGRDRGGGHRAPEEPLEHLREDGRAGQGVRRDPRPRGDPRHRDRGEGLLGRARGGARPLAAGAGPVQGLHQLAEVQPLPVAAHDRRRSPREAARDPDPHPGDAPPGRARHRRPLGLQGRRHERQARRPSAAAPARPTRSPGCSGSSTGSARPPIPSSSSRR